MGLNDDLESLAQTMAGRRLGLLPPDVSAERFAAEKNVQAAREQVFRELLSDDMVELVAQTISDLTGVEHIGSGEHWAFADARAILEAIVAAKEKTA